MRLTASKAIGEIGDTFLTEYGAINAANFYEPIRG
jgi:hypothetical protein